MSVAQQLGTGAAFGRLSQGQRDSARGRAKAKAEGEIPQYELVRQKLSTVARCPLNPRMNFGSDEDLLAFGHELARAQLAACVAVSREAYLRLWPEQQSQFSSEIEVVLLNGERRYRSAQKAGLEVLDFVIRDDLAESKETFLENLLEENLQREDFDVIERARGVAAMVELCGEQQKAAARFKRDKSWVSNQLLLLTLPTAIQVMLSGAGMPERHGRRLARQLKKNPDLSVSDLVELWEEIKKEEEEERVRSRNEKRLRREAAATAGTSVPETGKPPADEPAVGSDSGPELSMDNSVGGERPRTAVPAEGGTGSTGTVQTEGAENPEAARRAAAQAPPAQRTGVTGSSGGSPAVAVGTRAPAPREADGREAAGEDSAGDDGDGRQRQVPDWRDLDAVAAWIVRYLQPDEATTVAQAVLSKVEMIRQTPAV